MSKASPFLSVVIPSYNELRNVQRDVLEEVVNYLKRQTYSWEVILTDDGSTDGTVAKLQEFADKNPDVRVLANSHAGKGPTVQSGMLAATGEWRLFTDFDQSTPLSEIEKLLPFTSEFDIVIGSREIAGAVRAREPLHRHIMGKIWNIAVQSLAVSGILDTQCGFKLFRGEVADKLFSNLSVYDRQNAAANAFTGAFDVELLFVARKNNISIKEVPISWKHYATHRVSAVRDSLRMLRDIIRIRLADMQGKYTRS